MSALEAAGGPEFEVRTERRDDEHHIILRGELDLATAPKLEDELVRAVGAEPVVVLDLHDLSFIDSTGLRLVLAAHQDAQSAGCEFSLLPGPEPVQRVFEISGVEQMLVFRSQ